MSYVYSMHRVGKTVPPKRQILKDISLSFLPGAKIGILGLNGSGKSTLLRIMAGLDTDIDGEAKAMADLEIGYLEQEPKLDPEKTVRETVEEALSEILSARKRLEEIYAAYGDPDANFDALANEQARLEAILFSQDGENVEQQLEIAADALRLPPWDAKIGPLSGGEKRRVALCRLLLSGPGMLLLDEPTNHLDIATREHLEETLSGYSGTLIVATHDRYLVNRLATKVIEVADGGIRAYVGTYADYLRSKAAAAAATSEAADPAPARARVRREAPEPDPVLRRRLAADVREAERQVTQAEERLRTVEAALGDPTNFTNNLAELGREHAALLQQVESLTATWAELAEAAEGAA